jgi:hypothetical protein
MTLAGGMGVAGRQRALERFSIEVGEKRSEEFYRQCIEDRRRR